MNTNIYEGEKLANDIQTNIGYYDTDKFNLILIPPFTHLYLVNQAIDSDKVKLGAQNIFWEEKGAYTGEISAEMVKSTGAEYVIIGHSERRQYFNETSDILSRKINIALKYNLKPIYCVGEKLQHRDENKHFDIVKSQIEEVIYNLDNEQIKNVIIAYEPVWAIGTGHVATPEQAQEMHQFIRNLIKEKYGEDIADNMTILYGGSVKPNNAEGLFSQPDIDGGLVGGASLKAKDFLDIFFTLIKKKNY